MKKPNYEFMCGSYFKNLCKYSIQEYTDARNHRFCFKIHKNGDPSKVFCKTEYLNQFLENFLLEEEFDLVTHNSDININEGSYDHAKKLQPSLRFWYTQNLNYHHDMMKVIPIGLANPKWAHGDQDVFKKIQQENLSKNTILDVNFDIYTNLLERQKCLDLIDLPMRDRLPFEDHLRQIASSFFCISPNGNGLDCHRHWEALYLKTVPIVTRSPVTQSMKEKGLPILILEDWKEFKKVELNAGLYYDITNGFDWNSLNSLFLNS